MAKFLLFCLVLVPSIAASQCANGEGCSPEEAVETSLLQHMNMVNKSAQGQSCSNSFSSLPYAEQDKWATNYYGWEKCGGQMQSPINIQACDSHRVIGRRLDYAFNVAPNIVVSNTGKHIAVAARPEFGALNIPDGPYTAHELHFHTGSEHQIEGGQYDAEMHVVGQNPRGEFAVIGILFKVGRENSCLARVFDNVPQVGCERDLGKAFDLGCMSEMQGDYWNYRGSLTTPPCSEMVKWFVMKQIAELSQRQFNQLSYTFSNGGNFRVPQPLNGRVVQSVCTTCG